MEDIYTEIPLCKNGSLLGLVHTAILGRKMTNRGEIFSKTACPRFNQCKQSFPIPTLLIFVATKCRFWSHTRCFLWSQKHNSMA